MRARRRCLALVAWCAAAIAGAQEPAAPTSPVDRSAQVTNAPPLTAAPPDAPPQSLPVRYAAAKLRLAELDLARAVAANEAVPDSVGPREVDRLRNHVEMLTRHLAIAREHPRTAARQVTIAAAEAAVADARADLEAALRANHRVRKTIGDINIERLRVKLELAETRVALCKSSDAELSLLAELEWNVEQLTDEVIELRHRVETGGVKDAGQPR